MRAITLVFVAMVGLLAVFAAAGDVTPEQQAIIDEWAADPANADQFIPDQESGSGAPMRVSAPTAEERAAKYAASHKISIEEARTQLANMQAGIRTAGAAAIEAARGKKK